LAILYGIDEAVGTLSRVQIHILQVADTSGSQT
jgi:hypothetical protein